jgi:hypothetical protein
MRITELKIRGETAAAGILEKRLDALKNEILAQHFCGQVHTLDLLQPQ